MVMPPQLTSSFKFVHRSTWVQPMGISQNPAMVATHSPNLGSVDPKGRDAEIPWWFTEGYMEIYMPKRSKEWHLPTGKSCLPFVWEVQVEFSAGKNQGKNR